MVHLQAMGANATDLAFVDLATSRIGGMAANSTDLKAAVPAYPVPDYAYAYKVLRAEFDSMRPTPTFVTRENRVQGKNYYTNWTDQDLLKQVNVARILDASNPIANGIVNKLVSFVLQTGGVYKAVTKTKSVKSPQGYLAAGQELIDQWLEENQWQFEEEEHVRCAIVDGELAIHKARDEDSQDATCRRVEPEQIIQPPGKTILDGWRLGVQHRLDDVRKILAYNINWQLGVPTNPNMMGVIAPSHSIIHYKRNVVGSVARGVSDFFCNADDLDKIDRALDAIGAGTIARSKIAYFRTHKDALPGAVDAFAEANKTGTFYNPLTQQTENKFIPPDGGVADVPDTVGVATMPQGNTLEAIEAVNLLVRLTIAHRWGMPEFVASADASNNNYASILVAGNPFVIAIRLNQARFRAVWRECLRWVVRVKIAMGLLPADWLEYCDVAVTLPDPVIANALEDEQVRDIRYRNKAISPQTYATQCNLNYDDEQANWKEAVAADPMYNVSALPGMDDIMQGRLDQTKAVAGSDRQESAGYGLMESANWDESKHPRADDGKFGSGGGGSKEKGADDRKFTDKGGEGDGEKE